MKEKILIIDREPDIRKILASLLEDQNISRKSVKNLLEGGFIYPGVFGDLDDIGVKA